MGTTKVPQDQIVQKVEDTWHYIGAAGEPAFQNSWVNYETPEATFYQAAYTKDSLGYVHLRGIVKNGTVGSGVAMFTLPAGYRPGRSIRFATNANNAMGAYGISSVGACYLEAGSNVFVFLENIIFKAEQ